jgi:hypothetical protein
MEIQLSLPGSLITDGAGFVGAAQLEESRRASVVNVGGSRNAANLRSFVPDR